MPRTAIQMLYSWNNDQWKEAFARVDDSNLEIVAFAEEVRR